MSFEVRATYPFEGDFSRDADLFAIAGRHSEFSGAGACRDLDGGREHGWTVQDFREALWLRERMERVPGVIVRIQETVSP